MSLSSIQLDAFLAVAQLGSFSRAAQELHVTQSALSQRILNLEDELQTSLFNRAATGVQLTEVGHELLRYCQGRRSLEEEFVSKLKSGSEISGVIRIAGYSSVMRSVIFPSLSVILRSNPKVQIEALTLEVWEVSHALLSGKAEFAITEDPIQRAGIESVNLGEEEYVLVESQNQVNRGRTYLDQDVSDQTTEKYFRSNKKKRSGVRSFVDEVYGILDGVSLGWGRGVLPKHLIDSENRIKVVRGHKPMYIPVTLNYFSQPFYSKLHGAVVKALVENSRKYLT